MGEVSPEGVARALESLYRDPARRQALAPPPSRRPQPGASWDVIARQFDDLFVALGSSSRIRGRLAHG